MLLVETVENSVDLCYNKLLTYPTNIARRFCKAIQEITFAFGFGGTLMKIISLFNNKGGVGKSTLSYHLGCALGVMGKRVLFVDLDPQCNTIYNLISDNKISKFPKKFVQFIGFTIYNAKKYTAQKNPNPYNLATAHYRYALLIPQTIRDNIKEQNIAPIPSEQIYQPIGGLSVMYTHNTYPSVAQSLKCPMWSVPEVYTKMKQQNIIQVYIML